MISSGLSTIREMHYVTDDEAKINRGNRIGDPIASVDFCSVPSCYPSVHFVSLWGAILGIQGFLVAGAGFEPTTFGL